MYRQHWQWCHDSAWTERYLAVFMLDSVCCIQSLSLETIIVICSNCCCQAMFHPLAKRAEKMMPAWRCVMRRAGLTVGSPASTSEATATAGRLLPRAARMRASYSRHSSSGAGNARSTASAASGPIAAQHQGFLFMDSMHIVRALYSSLPTSPESLSSCYKLFGVRQLGNHTFNQIAPGIEH